MIRLLQIRYPRPLKINKRLLFYILLSFLPVSIVFAQVPDNYKWWNPVKNSFLVVEGQGWPNKMTSTYSRVPGQVLSNVDKMSSKEAQQSTGLLIRFKSNTNEVIVKYTVKNKDTVADLPQTAISGLDLYAVDADGNFFWCKGSYRFGDTIEYHFSNLIPHNPYNKKGCEYRLYLPLFSTISSLKIGVPESVELKFLPVRAEKPIVIYGGADVQGVAASRPGLQWTAMLGRNMDRPLINLGFSHFNAFNIELINLLTEIDAKIYILDFSSKEIPDSSNNLKESIIHTIIQIRNKQPFIPILLINGNCDDLNVKDNNDSQMRNTAIEDAYAELKEQDVDHLYLLSKKDVRFNQNSFVNSNDLSSIGMQQYAEGVEKITRTILKEPVGAASTTQPKTQTRDANIYDWEIRHRYILNSNKAKQPDIIFLGNSITHYWGGLPHGPIESAGDAKNPFFESLNAADLGYGWDRVENVLWRIYHGELDGYRARQAVLLIGTNNLDVNSDSEIIEGLKYLVHGIEVRQSGCKVLILGLLPRRGYEERISEINRGIVQLAGILNIRYADAGKIFLKPNGQIDESLFSDGLHPTATGYRKLENFLHPYLIKQNEK